MKLTDLETGLIQEKYSPENKWLLKYMKTKPVDPYLHWHQFRDWYEQNEHDFEMDFEQLIASLDTTDEEFADEPEYFNDLPKEIQAEFEDAVREDLINQIIRDDPARAPTWGHLDLNQNKLLPRNTWLVHFTDHASDVSARGFQYGIEDMAELGLTTYFTDRAKENGGYNFAFIADSRHALAAANGQKYGEHFVIFQNSGVLAYHYGDGEDQVMFHGADVDPRDVVYVQRSYGDFMVMPHPHKHQYDGQESKEGAIFKTESYEAAVAWVKKNIDQYRKVITGR